ncbi:MAG: sigma-70 family RNA polymerase sigma factor [bacterium]|nr:sigma-70 family RNA polymerase sigma factor [bacterium]
MQRLAAGDRAALATLVVRHQRRAFALAYRTTGDLTTAEDITQEAFLRVWRSADRYQPSARFTTWLHRIVVNLCLDSFRRRRPQGGDPPDGPDEAAVEPQALLERDERARQVRRAVAALPERQRVALVLHRFSELPLREIAEVTDWSESAVESLLVRAYAALRKSLKDLET